MGPTRSIIPRLLVIGAGSGGLAAAQKAAAEAHVGGTCVNEGCVPTKMLMYAARLAEQFDAECVDWGKMNGAHLGMTTDGIFELDALPKKTVVVGDNRPAFVVEFASILKLLGSDAEELVT